MLLINWFFQLWLCGLEAEHRQNITTVSLWESPLPFILLSFSLAEREKQPSTSLPASLQPAVAVLGSISLTLLSSPSPSCQIPHLAEGVRIHGEKVTEALRPFHERLEACFKQLREKVEKQYGVKTLVRASTGVDFDLQPFWCQTTICLHASSSRANQMRDEANNCIHWKMLFSSLRSTALLLFPALQPNQRMFSCNMWFFFLL